VAGPWRKLRIPLAVASIRCITLDWGDTLAANVGMPYLVSQRRALERLALALRSLDCLVPEDWTQLAMRELEQAWAETVDEVANREQREFDFQGLLQRWLGRTDAFGVDPARLSQLIRAFFLELTEVIPAYAESLPMLSLFKARGYRLGILSHVPWPGEACRAWFARHGLSAYIDFYSLSSEVGFIKPNPKHFEHALAHAGCPPQEVLHVGDHPRRDVLGARAMGMRTCLRLTEGIYPAAELEACRPDATITRLGQLHAVVEELTRA